jgi:hypothetical protein
MMTVRSGGEAGLLVSKILSYPLLFVKLGVYFHRFTDWLRVTAAARLEMR